MSGLHPYAGGKTSLAFKKDGNKIDSGQGDTAVTDNTFSLADKYLPGRGNKRKEGVRQTHRRPFYGGRKTILYFIPKDLIGIDPNPLTAQISHRPFRRTSTTLSFNIAVVGGQKNIDFR